MDGSRNQRTRQGLVATRAAAVLVAVIMVVACVALVVQIPGAPSESAEPVLRAYAVPEPELDHTSRTLKARFEHDAAVKIAIDPRTRQILVLAPPLVHAEVGRLLGPPATAPHRQPTDPTTTASNTVPARPATTVAPNNSQSSAATVSLVHISGLEFERSLARLWQDRLPASESDDPTWRTIPLRAPAGEPAVVKIDRRQGRVIVQGPEPLRRSWLQLIGAIDRPPPTDTEQTAVLPVQYAERQQVRYALTALQNLAPQQPAGGRAGLPGDGGPVTVVAQADNDDAPAGTPTNDASQPAADAAAPANDNAAGLETAAAPLAEQSGNLIGDVQIQMIEGLDVIVVRGHRRDVERIVAIINEIERLSAETEPVITVFPLQQVDSVALTEMVSVLYAQTLAPRSGQVSLTALVKPNAVLIIGRPEGVRAAKDLIRRLDQPVGPATQFRVFQLRYASAADVEETVTTFYEERGGLGMQVRVIADYRSNALIVQASPRDMAEIERLIQDIDVSQAAATNELRVFRLKNSLADELAPVIQEAINVQATGSRTTTGGQTGGTGGTNRTDQLRSTMLSFMAVDSQGRQLLKSGILTDVLVTADPRANALLVRGPESSMPLIEALVEQLDSLPSAVAQVKVFTIVNGDAINMSEMLEDLFEQQTQGATGLPALQTGPSAGDTSLIPLRFSVDERTNSIIASGSAGDLTVVEAILLRLDESDISQRDTTVYRLNNAPASDVAAAITQLLQSEREVEQVAIEQISPFRQIEREVIVVPEPVTNSLIISATPRYFEDVMEIVENLDKRPSMVVIQVLLAAVRLGEINEMGVELGLQNSFLFDRSVVDAAVGAAGVLDPGFLFNNQQLGNSNSTDSLATRAKVGKQGISTFGVGRTNPDLGYGGMVVSAGSDSVSVLIRALEQTSRLQVLSRPQVMTLDNQPAFVQVGQRYPRITSVQVTNTGTVNNTVLENVGILLGVTPRISPDGLVVMEIDAERSELSSQGVPIGTDDLGNVIESPIIDIATAQTTVSARSGQTVILGGLITTNSAIVNRKVPFLGDIPIAGHLFRYDSVDESRDELLIIMTPYVVNDEADAECIKQVETQRMSWCLADVVEVHGEGVLSGMGDAWSEAWDAGPTDVIYPDRQPTAPEPVPAPPLPDYEIAPPGNGQTNPPSEPNLAPRPVDAQSARPLSGQVREASADARFRGEPHRANRESFPVRPVPAWEQPASVPPGSAVVPAEYRHAAPWDGTGESQDGSAGGWRPPAAAEPQATSRTWPPDQWVR